MPQLLLQRADGCDKSAETLGIGAPAGWFQAANRGLLRWRDVPPGRRQAGLWDINAESWGIPIVVLPFANLSKDPEQQYFADAITDDLTTDLSRISGSFVIAATTAFTYKGKGLGANQIGHELGVRYVLEGSVRHTGDHVQVNVQLIDGESGAHLWADRFESHRANVAKAQSEITGRLARTLNLELAEAVGRRLEQDGSIDTDVYDFLMRGWASYYRPASAAVRQEALRAFEQALEVDPQSVEARIGIGTVLVDDFGPRVQHLPGAGQGASRPVAARSSRA